MVTNLEDRYRPPLSQFLNSVEALPLLEVICLRRAGPILTLPVPTSTRTATLPALRRIEIICTCQSEVEVPCRLLRQLEISVTVTIVISSHTMFRSVGNFSAPSSSDCLHVETHFLQYSYDIRTIYSASRAPIHHQQYDFIGSSFLFIVLAERHHRNYCKPPFFATKKSL